MIAARKSDFKHQFSIFYIRTVISRNLMSRVHSFDPCRVCPKQLLQQGRGPANSFESVRPKLI